MKKNLMALSLTILSLVFLFQILTSSEKEKLLVLNQIQEEKTLEKKSLKYRFSKEKSLVDDEAKQELMKYEEQRKSFVFSYQLDEEIGEKLKDEKLVFSFVRYYKDLSLLKEYRDEDEKMRMATLDYLSDVALGYIKFSKKVQQEVSEVLYALLLSNIPIQETHERQIKSLVGDKIDLMSHYTQKSKDEAFQYLLSQKDSKYADFLEQGFFNGLFFLNLSKKDINHYRKLLSKNKGEKINV